MAQEAAYWLTVALVAIAAVVAFKLLAATKLGAAVPGMTELAAFI